MLFPWFPARSVPFRSIPSHSVPFHSVPLPCTPFRSILFCSISFNSIQRMRAKRLGDMGHKTISPWSEDPSNVTMGNDQRSKTNIACILFYGPWYTARWTVPWTVKCWGESRLERWKKETPHLQPRWPCAHAWNQFVLVFVIAWGWLVIGSTESDQLNMDKPKQQAAPNSGSTRKPSLLLCHRSRGGGGLACDWPPLLLDPVCV